MKEETGRWQRRIWAGRRGTRRERLGDISAHATGVSAPEPAAPPHPPCSLAPKHQRAPPSRFAAMTSPTSDRSDELLAHPHLWAGRAADAERGLRDRLRRPAPARRPGRAGRDRRNRRPWRVFPDDVALIVGMELAQMRVLDEVFGLSAVAGEIDARLQHRRADGRDRRRGLRPRSTAARPTRAGAGLRRAGRGHGDGRPVHPRTGARRGRGDPRLPRDLGRGPRTDRSVGVPLAEHGADPGRGQDARPAREGDPRPLPEADDAPPQPEPLAAAAFADRLEAEHPQPRPRP